MGEGVGWGNLCRFMDDGGKFPLGGSQNHRLGRNPGICGSERGRLWCVRAGPRAARAAGVLCGARIAIPCTGPRLSEPGV